MTIARTNSQSSTSTQKDDLEHQALVSGLKLGKKNFEMNSTNITSKLKETEDWDELGFYFGYKIRGESSQILELLKRQIKQHKETFMLDNLSFEEFRDYLSDNEDRIVNFIKKNLTPATQPPTISTPSTMSTPSRQEKRKHTANPSTANKPNPPAHSKKATSTSTGTDQSALILDCESENFKEFTKGLKQGTDGLRRGSVVKCNDLSKIRNWRELGIFFGYNIGSSTIYILQKIMDSLAFFKESSALTFAELIQHLLNGHANNIIAEVKNANIGKYTYTAKLPSNITARLKKKAIKQGATHKKRIEFDPNKENSAILYDKKSIYFKEFDLGIKNGVSLLSKQKKSQKSKVQFEKLNQLTDWHQLGSYLGFATNNSNQYIIQILMNELESSELMNGKFTFQELVNHLHNHEQRILKSIEDNELKLTNRSIIIPNVVLKKANISIPTTSDTNKISAIIYDSHSKEAKEFRGGLVTGCSCLREGKDIPQKDLRNIQSWRALGCFFGYNTGTSSFHILQKIMNKLDLLINSDELEKSDLSFQALVSLLADGHGDEIIADISGQMTQVEARKPLSHFLETRIKLPEKVLDLFMLNINKKLCQAFDITSPNSGIFEGKDSLKYLSFIAGLKDGESNKKNNKSFNTPLTDIKNWYELGCYFGYHAHSGHSYIAEDLYQSLDKFTEQKLAFQELRDSLSKNNCEKANNILLLAENKACLDFCADEASQANVVEADIPESAPSSPPKRVASPLVSINNPSTLFNKRQFQTTVSYDDLPKSAKRHKKFDEFLDEAEHAFISVKTNPEKIETFVSIFSIGFENDSKLIQEWLDYRQISLSRKFSASSTESDLVFLMHKVAEIANNNNTNLQPLQRKFPIDNVFKLFINNIELSKITLYRSKNIVSFVETILILSRTGILDGTLSADCFLKSAKIFTNVKSKSCFINIVFDMFGKLAENEQLSKINAHALGSLSKDLQIEKPDFKEISDSFALFGKLAANNQIDGKFASGDILYLLEQAGKAPYQISNNPEKASELMHGLMLIVLHEHLEIKVPAKYIALFMTRLTLPKLSPKLIHAISALIYSVGTLAANHGLQAAISAENINDYMNKFIQCLKISDKKDMKEDFHAIYLIFNGLKSLTNNEGIAGKLDAVLLEQLGNELLSQFSNFDDEFKVDDLSEMINILSAFNDSECLTNPLSEQLLDKLRDQLNDSYAVYNGLSM